MDLVRCQNCQGFLPQDKCVEEWIAELDERLTMLEKSFGV